MQAQSIQPVQAQSVEAQPIQAAHSMPAHLVKPSYDTESGRTPTNEAAAQSASTQGFIGSWDMRIPGAAYTTPGTPGSGYDTLHTSVGAIARGLIIRANHTYTWESQDGRWRSSGDAEYPLLLIHGLDGHDWKVGTGAGVPGLTERDIIVWDGYSYYYGKRAAGEPAE